MPRWVVATGTTGRTTSWSRRDVVAFGTASAIHEVLAPRAAAAPASTSSAAPPAPEWRNRHSGMSYRSLGRTGFMVSEMVVGGNLITPGNSEHVPMALDAGLNYLDTAPAYGKGASEGGYAQVIKARKREQFFLNTKISLWDKNRNALYKKIFDSLSASEKKKLEGQIEDEIERRHVMDPEYFGPYFGAGQAQDLREATLANLMAKRYGSRIDRKIQYKKVIIDSLEQSLARLGTDHVDLMMCPHGASTPYEVSNHQEIFEAYELLRKQGKVRFLGVSAHTDPAGILEAAGKAKVYAVAMVAYNIMNASFVDKALATAKDQGLGVIAMKVARPVFPGSGKMRPPPSERLERLHQAVPGPLKVPQKAYVWALRNPNLTAVISEMGSAEIVKDNLPLVTR